MALTLPYTLAAGAVENVTQVQLNFEYLRDELDTVVTDGELAVQLKLLTGSSAGIVFGGDVNLYRSAANELKTDDYLLSGVEVYARHSGAAQVFMGNIPGAFPGVVFGLDLDTNLYRSAADTLKTDDALNVALEFRHLGSTLGFYNATATTKPTGVAVTAGGIHAALVTLGLIAA